MKARKVKKLDPAGTLAENAARIVLVRVEGPCAPSPPTRPNPRPPRPSATRESPPKRLRYVLEATGTEVTGATSTTPGGGLRAGDPDRPYVPLAARATLLPPSWRRAVRRRRRRTTWRQTGLAEGFATAAWLWDEMTGRLRPADRFADRARPRGERPVLAAAARRNPEARRAVQQIGGRPGRDDPGSLREKIGGGLVPVPATGAGVQLDENATIPRVQTRRRGGKRLTTSTLSSTWVSPPNSSRAAGRGPPGAKMGVVRGPSRR